ncbi:MAG: lysylphosphatidylglycerol synthase transmembrane domain-containing protein [Solirubrobacteraceae bacterium]|jgi:uncharacterized protein (TIRG00374 family)
MTAQAPPAEVNRSDLAVPPELSRRRLRSRLLVAVLVLAVVVAVIVLLPGLGSLRSRLSHANPYWLLLGVALKLLSELGYVAAFRMIFCRRMSWLVSWQIGMAELAANALFPTGGAGGLALGAWALRRGGMPAPEIARRSVSFFLLTSVPNVVGVIVIGVALAIGVLPGEHDLLLTALPAAVAAAAIVAALQAGRFAGKHDDRATAQPHRTGSARVRALRASVTAIAGGVSESLALLREANAILIAGLLAYLVFDVMILWATFRAIGPAPLLGPLAMGYLIGELGGLIPVPGGIGGIDAGLVGALVLYHVPLTAAAGAVLAYRAIVLWVPATVGGAAFVLLRRTLRREADAVAVCAPATEMEIIGLGRAVIRPEAPAG